MNKIPEIHDIHGLDTIPWWPPGPGWWLTGLLGLMVLFLLVWLVRESLRPRWQRDANRQIRRLQMRMPIQDNRTTASQLSELLRRIAMARYGREQCAGLSGKEWLDWLSTYDPTGFDWHKYSPVLNDLPFAPKDIPIDRFDLRLLLRATRQWVNAPSDHRIYKTPSTENV